MVAMAMETEAENGAPNPPDTRSRLVIRSFELENFKSYVGVKRIGPLHKRFNAVVGPNGSGKSNIIDAMMFVFGKKASKLRMRRISDVIHKSAAFPNINSARVTVHMHDIIDKEGEDFDVIPDSEFSITRTATIDSKSEYYINSTKSSFKEVVELLKSKGVDLGNSRFLILQGEIEMISQMKPKCEGDNEMGFLEYFEDIIGTDVYVGEIDKLTAEMSTLDEEILLLKRRVAAVERRCENLEGPRKEAEAYLAKAADIEANKTYILLHELEKYKGRQSDLKSLLEDTLGRIKDSEESNEALKAEEEEKKKVDAMAKSVADLQKKVKELRKRFAEFEKQDAELSQKKKHLKTKMEKIVKDQEQRQKELKVSSGEAQSAENELPVLEEKGNTLRMSLKKEEEELKKMKEEIHEELEGIQKELTDARNALAPFSERTEQVKVNMKRFDAQREAILEKQKATSDRLETLREQFKEAQTTMASQQQAMKEMEQELAKLREQSARAKDELNGLDRENERIELSITEAQHREREKRGALDAMNSQNQTLKLLMEAKQSGKLPGFYGILGQLGAVDAKFEVAMSQACPMLRSYVVETMDEAIKAGNILRAAKAGSVRFIPLDRISYLNHQMNRGFHTPQGARRLFDVVQIANDRLRPAFYYACRDTMVVNDLDVGMQINSGQRKFKFVTYKGEVIETSGAMTGGGGPPRRGLIRIGNAPPVLEDPHQASTQLEAITADLEAKIQEANRLREKSLKIKEDVKNMDGRIERIEGDLTKTRGEVEAAKIRGQSLTEKISVLEESKKVAGKEEKEVLLLESKSDECKLEIRSIEEECVRERAKLNEAQQKLDDAGGPAVRGKKERVQELMQEIKSVDDDLASRRALLVNVAKSSQRAERDAAKSEEQKIAVKNDEEAVLREIEGIEKVALKVLASIRKLDSQVEKEEELLAKARQKFEEASQKGNLAREAAAKLDMEKKGRETQLEDLEKRINNYLEQVSEHIARFANLQPDVPLPELSEEGVVAVNVKELEKECDRLTLQLENMNPNAAALDEYRKRKAELDEQEKVLDEELDKKKEMEAKACELEKKRLQEFLAGFREINFKLKEVFRMLTIHGQAELDLVDSMNPFSDGVEFTVRPPQKAWKSISNLSGGEKTLSSLSLVLALHHYKPSPIYVMDEIDAALDWRNVAIVAHCVREHTKAAQFLIISLRDQMFGLADRLMGVTKVNDATRTLTIDPSTFSMTAVDHASDMEE